MYKQCHKDPLSPWDESGDYDEICHILDLPVGMYVMIGIRTIAGRRYAYPLIWDDVTGRLRRYDITYGEDLITQQIELRASEHFRTQRVYLIYSGVSNLPHRPHTNGNTIVTL